MKIYTKTGDQGQTGLLGGQRLDKDDPRVQAYGTVDELNAVLGLARTHGLDLKISDSLGRVQEGCFTLGSQLAAPTPHPKIPHARSEWVSSLEREIDVAEEHLPPLHNFIVPGGAAAAAWLHFARTVCRRAERAVVSLSHCEPIDPLTIMYLNRLSDWLFVMARAANQEAGAKETVWRGPGS